MTIKLDELTTEREVDIYRAAVENYTKGLNVALNIFEIYVDNDNEKELLEAIRVVVKGSNDEIQKNLLEYKDNLED